MKKKPADAALLRAVIRQQSIDIQDLSNGLRERIAQSLVGKNGYFSKIEADAMFAWITKKGK